MGSDFFTIKSEIYYSFPVMSSVQTGFENEQMGKIMRNALQRANAKFWFLVYSAMKYAKF